MITFDAYFGIVKVQTLLDPCNILRPAFQFNHLGKGQRVQLHFHGVHAPWLANFFVPGRHRIAQPFQNTPQGSAIGNFRFALLAHLEAAVFCGGQLERDQVARFVLPFLTAQTQQLAASDQRSLGSVKHPVALKMRAKAVRPVIHKRLTQGLQIHMGQNPKRNRHPSKSSLTARPASGSAPCPKY